MTEYYSIGYTYHVVFLHSSADGVLVASVSWLMYIVLLESSGWTGLYLSRSSLHLRGGLKLSQEKWLEG